MTLLYLASQIRQNTAALGTASRQEVASGYRHVNRLWFDMPIASSFAKGLDDFPNMPFEDRVRFSTMLSEQALFHQGAFALYESGQLDESTYFAYRDWFACIISTPGGLAWWEELARPIYEGRMIEVIDARVAAGGLPDVRSLSGFRLDDSSQD